MALIYEKKDPIEEKWGMVHKVRGGIKIPGTWC